MLLQKSIAFAVVIYTEDNFLIHASNFKSFWRNIRLLGNIEQQKLHHNVFNYLPSKVGKSYIQPQDWVLKNYVFPLFGFWLLIFNVLIYVSKNMQDGKTWNVIFFGKWRFLHVIRLCWWLNLSRTQYAKR